MGAEKVTVLDLIFILINLSTYLEMFFDLMIIILATRESSMPFFVQLEFYLQETRFHFRMF